MVENASNFLVRHGPQAGTGRSFRVRSRAPYRAKWRKGHLLGDRLTMGILEKATA